jgi:hypothetical protein
MTRNIDAASLGIDPDELNEILGAETVSGKRGPQRGRRTDRRHIGAPLAFMEEVCLLTDGRAALMVALYIYRRVCVCDSWTVTLPNAELARLGVERRRKGEALTQLENVGLIKVKKNSAGRSARVSLIWQPMSSEEDT